MRTPLTLLAATVLLGTALLTGCSAGDSQGSGDEAADTGGALTSERDSRTSEPEAVVAEDRAADGDAAEAAQPAQQRAVISTGTVSLRGEDVGAVRFEVQRVTDEVGGQVGEEETETDEEGEVHRSRLVLRVPSARFDDAMTSLAGLAELVRSTRGAEDVTTQVIDTDARVRAQAASLRRVEALLDQATTLKDVVAIERQLTQRQADLDSLRSQQAWLKEQTSLSTITVHLQRAEEAEQEEPREAGFVAGLTAGWSGLGTVAVGTATVLGAVLPFAVVAAVLLVPVVLLLRRRRTVRPVAGAQTTE